MESGLNVDNVSGNERERSDNETCPQREDCNYCHLQHAYS